MSTTWARDATERVAWTFAQAAIAAVGSEALAVAFVGGDVDVLRAAGIGGLAAVLSLVKSIAAKRVGDPNTASTLKTWTAKTPPPEFVNDEEHTDG